MLMIWWLIASIVRGERHCRAARYYYPGDGHHIRDTHSDPERYRAVGAECRAKNAFADAQTDETRKKEMQPKPLRQQPNDLVAGLQGAGAASGSAQCYAANRSPSRICRFDRATSPTTPNPRNGVASVTLSLTILSFLALSVSTVTR